MGEGQHRIGLGWKEEEMGDGGYGQENRRKGEVSGLESEDLSVNPKSTTLILVALPPPDVF